MRTETSIEGLNNYIDLLQANAGLRSAPHWQDATGTGQQSDLDVTMLQMAAHLNSMRPRATVPDEGFLSNLLGRVLAEATASHQRLDADG